MKTKIEVTQDHIDAARFLKDEPKAFRADRLPYGCRCPIALAMAEAGFPDSYVNTQIAWVSNNKPFVSLPDQARHFILSFDNGQEVRPFSFEIDIP